MTGDGKLRSEWNRALLEDVISHAYCTLLQHATTLEENPNYYELWPTCALGEPWKLLLVNIYHRLQTLPILFCHLSGGMWISPKRAVLFPNSEEGKEKNESLCQILLKGKLPIVVLPAKIWSLLKNHDNLSHVSPKFVRGWLREKKELPSGYSWEDGLFLLRYCLSDLSAETHDGEEYHDLVGVPLVPLATKSFGVFGGKDSASLYYIGTENENVLLERASEVLVAPMVFDMSNDIGRHLQSELLHKQLNIKRVAEQDFPQLLSYVLPRSWEFQSVVPFDSDADFPTREWLSLMWKYISSCDQLSNFSSWPLMATTDGNLCRLEASSHLFFPEGCSEEVVSLVTKLGCHCIDLSTSWKHKDMWKIVYQPSVSGILAAVKALAEQNQKIPGQLFHLVTGKERVGLRKFIISSLFGQLQESVGTPEPLLRQLPIFEVHKNDEDDEANFMSAFVDLTSERFIPPKKIDENLLTNKFFRLVLPGDNKLLKHLGVTSLSGADFYVDHVFPGLSQLDPKLRDSAMLGMMTNLQSYSLISPSFHDCVVDTAFVPCLRGSLHRACELYDPSVSELCALLDSERHFPGGVFASGDVLATLRSLGLQTSLNRKGVLDSIQTVCRFAESGSFDKSLPLSASLLKYLNFHSARLFGKDTSKTLFKRIFKTSNPQKEEIKEWARELASRPWLPIAACPPVDYIPWKLSLDSEKRTIHHAAAHDVRPGEG